jgi:hypothetical protein
MPVEMVRSKLLIRVQTVHRLTELIKIPKGFSDRGPGVRGAQGTDSLGHHLHRLQRWIQAMVIKPLQVSPDPPAVLGGRRTFTPSAHGIDASWCQGEERFETDIAFPVGAKVIHIPELLAAMEAQVA